MTIRERYSNKWHVQKAFNHMLGHGLLCALCVSISDWGWFALLSPWIAEGYQIITDPDYDECDGIYDLMEGLVGGLVVGLIFWTVRIYI
jgi:hypothetical protein